jgi:hypothetical protein
VREPLEKKLGQARGRNYACEKAGKKERKEEKNQNSEEKRRKKKTNKTHEPMT